MADGTVAEYSLEMVIHGCHQTSNVSLVLSNGATHTHTLSLSLRRNGYQMVNEYYSASGEESYLKHAINTWLFIT